MRAIREFDSIRLTAPLEGADVFDASRVFPLPVSARGTVVDMLGNRGAYEVEFLVRPDPMKPEYFFSVQIPVEQGQCELVED